MTSSGSMHRQHGRQRPQCRQHLLRLEDYLPQLRRLLTPEPAGAPEVFDSMVDEIIDAENPLELFDHRLRAGMYLIEALYIVQREQADRGDRRMEAVLAPLCYARWVAWRRFDEAMKAGRVSYDPDVKAQVHRSRDDVVDQLRAGWNPIMSHSDDELVELIGDC